MSKRPFYVTSGRPKGVSRPILNESVERFLSTGSSGPHTAELIVGSHLINELIDRGIAFRLRWRRKGAIIERDSEMEKICTALTN